MADIETIIDGVESILTGISGLRVRDYVPDDVQPPMAFIQPPREIDYDRAFSRGHHEFELDIVVLISRVADRSGQKALLAYTATTGASSIPAAFWADKTLNGAVGEDQSHLHTYRSLGVEEVQMIGWYGGVFTLKVIVEGP